MKRKKRSKRSLGFGSKQFNQRLYQAMIFLIKFNLFAVPLYLIIFSGFQWAPLKETTAQLSYGMLRLTGIDAAIDASVIILYTKDGEFYASIDWDCTGWKSMLALFALIFATDFPLRRKLAGLVFIPLIYIINIIRIWFMFFFVSAFGLEYYSIVHAVIWSWGLIAAMLILWVIWLKKDISKLKISAK